MKPKIVVSLTVVAILMLAGYSYPMETAPQEVIQAAIDGLGPFLKAIPSQDLDHYGFSDQKELAQAKLGKPFKVYTITPDKILNYNQENELAALISSTNLWFFPISYQGKARTILTVDLVNGKWKAVSIGSSGLAKELEKVKNTWPESNGYDLLLIRIYQAQSDFVAVSKDGISKIHPLESAAVALKLKKKFEGIPIMYKPSEIIPKLSPVVRENLQSHKSFDR